MTERNSQIGGGSQFVELQVSSKAVLSLRSGALGALRAHGCLT